MCSWQLQSSGSWGVVLERDKEHRLVAKTQDIIDLLFPLLTYFTHERLIASSKFSFGFIETTSFQATRSANLKRVSKCVQDKGQTAHEKWRDFGNIWVNTILYSRYLPFDQFTSHFPVTKIRLAFSVGNRDKLGELRQWNPQSLSRSERGKFEQKNCIFTKSTFNVYFSNKSASKWSEIWWWNHLQLSHIESETLAGALKSTGCWEEWSLSLMIKPKSTATLLILRLGVNDSWLFFGIWCNLVV